jgi:transitional endoplasmic reticulum ATPase
VDLKTLATGTAHCVGSDIEFICRRASLSAIRDYVGKEKSEGSSAKGGGKDYSNFEIKAKHFNQAIKDMAERKEGVK